MSIIKKLRRGFPKITLSTSILLTNVRGNFGGSSYQRQGQRRGGYPTGTCQGPLSTNSNLLPVPTVLSSKSLYVARDGPQTIGTANGRRPLEKGATKAGMGKPLILFDSSQLSI